MVALQVHLRKISKVMTQILHTKNLNLNVRGLKPSATLAINEYSKDLAAQGRKVYRFGFGQSPFPVPGVVVKELKKHAHQKDYLPVKGLYRLREAVARFTRERMGIQRDAEDVLIGPGSKELMFLLQLVYYGDLLIPRPGWVSYAPQAQIIGRHVHWIRTEEANDWHLTAEELEAICRTDPDRPRIVVLNYPANPTGTTFSRQELIELANVARKYGVILLSDEIYGELHHEGKHLSVAHFYPEGTIISSGLSKWCGAGGWRLGTFIFPPSLHWLLDAMAVAASETFTSTSAPIQYAAVRAFQGGEEIESYLWHSRRILKAVGLAMWQKLQDNQVKCPRPHGGFYLFPNFMHYRDRLAERGIMTSVELCAHLLEDTGVALLPAYDFGFWPRMLAARLSYVDFDGEAALELSHQYGDQPLDEAFVKQVAGKMLEGIDVMVDWLNR